MRRRYCFFDYDGTLRSRSLDAVPASAHAALDKLRENGHFVALATGRLQSDALEVLAPCGINTMVADGGNSVTIDGKLISIEGMPLEPSRAFAHRLDDEGWPGRQLRKRAHLPDPVTSRYASLVTHLYYTPSSTPRSISIRLIPSTKSSSRARKAMSRPSTLPGVTLGTLFR